MAISVSFCSSSAVFCSLSSLCSLLSLLRLLMSIPMAKSSTKMYGASSPRTNSQLTSTEYDTMSEFLLHCAHVVASGHSGVL